MYPASFEYHRAASVKDALAMLTKFGDDAKLLAGGHSLIPMMKLRLAQPAHLIDIGGIRDLAQIREDGGKIVIGGLATHHQVETSAIIKAQAGNASGVRGGDWRRAGAQPRHHRRQPGAFGSGGRLSRRDPRAGGRDARRGERRRTHVSRRKSSSST